MIKEKTIEQGMTFRDHYGKLCHVAQVFTEFGQEVITYRYWHRSKHRWAYKTMRKDLFLFDFRDQFKRG